ncbi:hypothetical protein SISSUDRAFT_1066742 [Sistotremastrum suecicum HHB10207 ss-3]|uniref:F-box domain-containing protein n=1 Tax=Sistotremastrum suecicum HHB10207 ss-3 TaxID=1314776 RepID=A0A165XYC8_9AGAM|nr:hypothetical protein SISSUDRAFT_1066742 [Sistotremastrum suecicum HHB10207 ss-3]
MDIRLPPELWGKIAYALRKTDAESLRRKTREEWTSENQSLLALCLTSKMLNGEAMPALWSEVIISAKVDLAVLEARASPILAQLEQSDFHYATYMKRLSILHVDTIHGDHWPPIVPLPSLTSILERVLTASRNLDCLRIYCNNDTLPILNRLSTLIFPRLKMVRIGIRLNNRQLKELVSNFLLAHPGLLEVRLGEGTGTSVWKSTRESNPLPLVTRFEGTLAQLLMFSQTQELCRLRVSRSSPRANHDSRPSIIRQLNRLPNPFVGVTHITFALHPIPLDLDILEAVADAFPSLVILDGFGVTPDFIEFIVTIHEKIEGDPVTSTQASRIDNLRSGI